MLRVLSYIAYNRQKEKNERRETEERENRAYKKPVVKQRRVDFSLLPPPPPSERGLNSREGKEDRAFAPATEACRRRSVRTVQ